MNYTLGESLLDIIFTNLNDVVAKPGGSMLNTAVSLGRMNLPVMHISEIGSNRVADMILDFLEKNGVNTDYIIQYKGENTSVALAFLDQKKKPSYQFVNAYPGLRKLKLPPVFHAGDILLFGSLYSISTPIRKDILTCIHEAKKAGSLVLYDPNIRHKHHLEEQQVVGAMLENLRLAHIIKASDEDCANLFGNNLPEIYLETLSQINAHALIILTLGAAGAMARFKNMEVKMEAIQVEVVSTIGAGDAFNAGLISALQTLEINHGNLQDIDIHQLKTILKKGIQTAATVCCSIENYIPATTGA